MTALPLCTYTCVCIFSLFYVACLAVHTALTSVYFVYSMRLFGKTTFLLCHRTCSKTICSTQLVGSRLVLADSGTPASILHTSAFIPTSDSPADSQVDVKNLQRPLYRKDIFYSGSVMNVNHMKSQMSMKSYIASVATIPDEKVIIVVLLSERFDNESTDNLMSQRPYQCRAD